MARAPMNIPKFWAACAGRARVQRKQSYGKERVRVDTNRLENDTRGDEERAAT